MSSVLLVIDVFATVVGWLTITAALVVGWVRLSIVRANRRRYRRYVRSINRWVGDR